MTITTTELQNDKHKKKEILKKIKIKNVCRNVTCQTIFLICQILFDIIVQLPYRTIIDRFWSQKQLKQQNTDILDVCMYVVLKNLQNIQIMSFLIFKNFPFKEYFSKIVVLQKFFENS